MRLLSVGFGYYSILWYIGFCPGVVLYEALETKVLSEKITQGFNIDTHWNLL